MNENKQITVCICTYKRPERLARLLKKMDEQETGDLFEYSVSIVDNDQASSARQAVMDIKEEVKMPVEYCVEPEQNIALARNRALGTAKGDFIAFIDDDEIPDKDWLWNLFTALQQYQAEIVLGPVKPVFETQPPDWITRGKLCERETFKTGTIIKDGKFTRTGNVLFSRKVVDGREILFNPIFGKTGGEDGDFFRRCLKKEYRIIWCDEAIVYETVPPERFRRSYFLKRSILQGSSFAKSSKLKIISYDTVKSAAAIIIYTPALIVLMLTRHDLFMIYLIKYCYHAASLLTTFNFRTTIQRTV